LAVETVMAGDKVLREVSGRDADGIPVRGYEMHMGRTAGDSVRPWLTLDGRADGAVSDDGRVRGCYLHGLFASDPWRAKFLGRLRQGRDAGSRWEESVDQALDRLADHLERHLDMDALLAIVFEQREARA
jgi:adenosylcobyric acid synthase